MKETLLNISCWAIAILLILWMLFYIVSKDLIIFYLDVNFLTELFK